MSYSRCSTVFYSQAACIQESLESNHVQPRISKYQEISKTPVHPKKADVIEAVIKAVIKACESCPASLQADHKLTMWRLHSLDAKIGEGWSINLHDKLA